MDRAILLFIFAVIIFSAPLANLWSQYTAIWFLPYLIWGLIILFKIQLQQWQDYHDD